jgi:hypothetical protein
LGKLKQFRKWEVGRKRNKWQLKQSSYCETLLTASLRFLAASSSSFDRLFQSGEAVKKTVQPAALAISYGLGNRVL